MKDELPEGWDVVKLPEVCQLNPGKPDASRVTGDTQVTFVPMAAVDAELGQITKPILRAYTEVSKGFTAFQENDVIMAKITPCMENGKAAIARGLSNGIGFGSTEFHVLRHSNAILPEYLFYFIRQDSFRKSAEANMTGSVGQKRVPVDFLKETILPLPPLNEQRRIAAKLEKLLSRVGAAQARLAAIPGILKRFRQSVLAAACASRLTADWRESSTTATIAAEVSKQPKVTEKYALPDEHALPELPDTWVHLPIGNIAEFQQGMQIAKKTRLKEPGLNRLPILRIGNYATGFKEDVDYVELDQDSLVAEAEDVILARTGETRGKVLTGYRGVVHNNTFRINYEQCLLIREYLITWLETDFVQSFIRRSSGRSAQPDLTHKAFGPCPLALPPLREQQEIVRRVEALFKTADALEARYHTANAYVDKLTQSILAKAFRGELVPQDPNDEPASALIENIRQQSSGHRVNKRGKKAVGT